MTAAVRTLETRPPVSCGQCRSELFDGLVVKSRVIRVLPNGQAEAKCKRCREWVRVPLVYAA